VAPAWGGEIRVSAANSLRNALNEISAAFARKEPGEQVVLSLGASGDLARQIESGAPSDLFISANEAWVSYLRQRKLLSSQPESVLAYTTLVFVGRPGIRASSLKDLLKLKRIAIGSPGSAPAGEYAMEALDNAFIARKLQEKLVLARDDRECLMYAERGEVDGALVYRTDALEAKRARILFTVPQNLYERVTYHMVLTLSGGDKREAREFFRYLQGAEAKRVLVRYGFQLAGRR